MNDDILKAWGSATPGWIDKVAELGPFIAGIDHVDLSDVRTDHCALLRQVIEILQPPQGVSIDIWNDNGLHIKGSAPWSWIERLPLRLEAIAWLRVINVEQLSIYVPQELEELVDQVTGKDIYFSQELRFREDSLRDLRKVIIDPTRISKLGAINGFKPRVELSGFTDGTGGPELNYKLRDLRAAAVIRQLASSGLAEEMFAI